jgi:FKBP-type peptidyl-prolyl cis-trans isomerase (trigger factor)
MSSYLLEYKERNEGRKVPGFRAGKLPTYVMADVQKIFMLRIRDSNRAIM